VKQTFVVTVEGVLRKITDGKPINVMLQMLMLLREGNTFIYLTEENATEVEEWLAIQGLPHDLVLGKNEDRVLQLRRIRHEWGYPIDVVIEPDPVIIAALINEGYTVLGCFHPAYARRQWRPDYKFEITPWEEVKAVVDRDIAQQRTDENRKIKDLQLP
jgi:hypothetical protein